MDGELAVTENMSADVIELANEDASSAAAPCNAARFISNPWLESRARQLSEHTDSVPVIRRDQIQAALEVTSIDNPERCSAKGACEALQLVGQGFPLQGAVLRFIYPRYGPEALSKHTREVEERRLCGGTLPRPRPRASRPKPRPVAVYSHSHLQLF